MAHVFATQRIPGRCFELITSRGHTLDVHPTDEILSTLQIIERLGPAEVLICTLANEITAEVFESAPQLRMVANYAVGYNNIDMEAATRAGVAVTNTPGALTEATADLTWALLMAAARRVVEGDRICRAGDFHGWLPTLLLGREVHGASIGIIGAGRIGSAVARRAKGFSMRIFYWSRSPKPELELELGAVRMEPVRIFETCDYVSLHLPLTPETHHLVDADMFARARKGIVFVNTGRGALVDEEALVRALEDGVVAAAGLDVFEREPAIHPRLLKMDNVVLLPHIGSATRTAREKMGELVALNVLSFLNGSRPPNILNPEVLRTS